MKKALIKILLIMAGVIFFDLVSKILIERYWPRAVSKNAGFIFGFGQIPASYLVVFILFLAILALAYFLMSTLNLAKYINWLGTALLLGGAVSNLIDRIFDFRVIDFISIPLISKFNLADICIILGVILLVWEQFASRRANRDEVQDRSY